MRSLERTLASRSISMTLPDYEAARQYALYRLEHELDPRLVYHTLPHTRDEVLPAVERLAALTGIDAASLVLLRTAALYHDIGFTIGRSEHELLSVRIAESMLPRFGYPAEAITQISAMIMATRLPQQPRSLLDSVLADADLDVLGREDFFERNRRLRSELEAFGQQWSDVDWYTDQLAFVNQYPYWTAAARSLRALGRAANIARLRDLLAQLGK